MGASQAESLLRSGRWLGKSGFLLEAGRTVYFDPFGLPDGLPKADIVFLTHNHPDHCSVPDVEKISRPQTIVVGSPDTICRFRLNQLPLAPGQTKLVLGVNVTGTAAYALTGSHHPRDSRWLGFLVELGGLRVFHSGDTDLVPEIANLRADAALLPVAGGDVMTAENAAQLAKRLGVCAALPVHFSAESRAQAEAFVSAVRKDGIGSWVPEPVGVPLGA